MFIFLNFVSQLYPFWRKEQANQLTAEQINFAEQICRANQLTGFYMMATLAFNELIFVDKYKTLLKWNKKIHFKFSLLHFGVKYSFGRGNREIQYTRNIKIAQNAKFNTRETWILDVLTVKFNIQEIYYPQKFVPFKLTKSVIYMFLSFKRFFLHPFLHHHPPSCYSSVEQPSYRHFIQLASN